MTQEEIKKLEKKLWSAADELRGNSKLTAAEYKDPLLGLVLLRFAQNRFEDAKIQIEKNLKINPRTKEKYKIKKSDYTAAGAIYLPEKAKYDYLADLPEGENIAEAINDAMKLIEAEYKDLQGILPKNYEEFSDTLLRSLVRVFNSDEVKNAKGDVFGRIYEFFLMKFSMQGAGAQEGGEFFTPPSLVNLIVHFIQPNHGIVHDPACGSGGMFVQTAHFIKSHANKSVNEAITVYGTELKSNNTRLAKMNLAIHGIEGTIIESNSFYTNPHTIPDKNNPKKKISITGQCDFVMANPPFNVDKVDAKNKFLVEDERLAFGVPLTGKGTCPNGNYLWAQYFHSYLNETGRAGFVMASSATDAGNSEKRIREQLVQTGDIDCIVSIANNFFYTRSLPCHVWFYDKGKIKANKKKVLMIDARNLYREVSSTINDFSPGQQRNLTTIIELYRKDKKAYSKALDFHKEYCENLLQKIHQQYISKHDECSKIIKEEEWKKEITLDKKYPLPKVKLDNVASILKQLEKPFPLLEKNIHDLQKEMEEVENEAKSKKIKKTEITKLLAPFKVKINVFKKILIKYNNAIVEDVKDAHQGIQDWNHLLEYFPDEKYRDIEGFCKVVDIEELKEQDFNLTPGIYVGVKIEIDMDFDYQGRMIEIKNELNNLNEEANLLMSQIQTQDI